MKITVVGTGYVGLVAGVCFADMGNDVICVDSDKSKVDFLNNGGVPIFEPGLGDMLRRNKSEERISFTTDLRKGIEDSTVIFIAVGTPPGKNHEADLSSVKEVAKNIGKYMNEYKVVVDKSTVPVGTAEVVEKIIRENQPKSIEFDVVSNPEFLREGAAIYDFTNPDRIVVGTNSDRARKIMREVYGGLVRTDKPLIFTDVKSARR
jgi:UDPglucose 6-dehydrogenase